MRGNGFRRFRRESEIIQGAFPVLLVAWAGGRIPDTRGLEEGRHRSRLRPSEALDPQGTPGALSRVRERVGVRANTTFQKPSRDTQAAAIAVSSGGGCGFAGGNRCADQVWEMLWLREGTAVYGQKQTLNLGVLSAGSVEEFGPAKMPTY